MHNRQPAYTGCLFFFKYPNLNRSERGRLKQEKQTGRGELRRLELRTGELKPTLRKTRADKMSADEPRLQGSVLSGHIRGNVRPPRQAQGIQDGQQINHFLNDSPLHRR